MSMLGGKLVESKRLEARYYTGDGNKRVFYFVLPHNSTIINVVAFKLGRFKDEEIIAKFFIKNGNKLVTRRITTNILSDVNIPIETGGIVLCELSILGIDNLVLFYTV